MPNLITQRTETAPIDEQMRRAVLTQQWLLERDEDIRQHPITAHNDIRVFVCGEEGFGRIAADLEAASETIEIACWGFDPAMELTRGGSGHWPRGPTLGDLLERKARQGVKVRLLAWYDTLGSIRQNNLIGYSEVMPQTRQEHLAMVGSMAGGGMGLGYQPAYARAAAVTPQDDRRDHCVLWWRRAMAGEMANVEVRLRAGDDGKVQASLASADVDPRDRPSDASGSALGMAHERRLIEGYATHYQKTILIDYEREQGRAAVGYVMGLNSLTDYWDSPAHHFNDARREVDWARKTKLGEALGAKRPVSRDPYQDYAARLRGEVLRQVEANFSQAWQRAQPGRKPLPALQARVPQRLKVTGPGRRIQVVRTQPEEGDRTVQRAYWQATRSARSYIYIENQYFYYEAWARHLKAMRHEFMRGVQAGGVGKSDAKMLHAFVVIPWPEDDGMVPRTYDTVKSLGEAGSMPKQDKAVTGESQRLAARQADYDRQLQAWRNSGGNYRAHPLPPPPQRNAIYESAAQVQAPEKNADGELGQWVPDVAGQPMKFEGLGLKVLLARMVSFNDAGHDGYVAGLPPKHNYRQVYIHSKLAIADDCWFTLGSANLNVRSMAADSEINVNVENGDVATDLRRRVWGLMTGGKHDGGEGMPEDVALAFEGWKKLMADNKSPFGKGVKPESGFLIPFEDKRFVEFRHG